MPLLKDWSSLDDSGSTPSEISDSSNYAPDSTYPALSFPGYAEKPLSKQLEPIAVVGMGCRLPGDVSSPAQFWDLMMEKRTGQTPKVPESRFNIDAHLHPNNERPGSFNVPGGYFLNSSLQEFDPALFGISPIEAMWMDPQQRKLLEVVYEAFESGGVTLNDVAGTTTACFVGSFTADYQQMTFKEPDFRHSYAATGVDPGIISNRISHVFNLRGPSITVNTACSSSVYAMHNACNALRNNECSAAVVSGTNLVLTVDQHMNTAKLGVLSPTSTCHTFNAHADGYGRADGVGAVYLKRLQDAIQAGDPIRAVIRSSAVNSNGKAPAVGITHPNLDGQEAVIRHAYRRGGDLDPRLTGYFEIHGTGTAIGDPLEVHAVSKAMNDSRPSGQPPLLIGAVKTNIGHSEAASGLSAVIKAVLTVEKGIIPPTRGVVKLNPAIDWENWRVQVVTDAMPFPPHLPVKRVSVNSFGYGGTNGHVIVESVDSFLTNYQTARPKVKPRGTFTRGRPFLLAFSAHDKPTLNRNIIAHGEAAKNYNLLDLAYTLGNRRTQHSSRAFVVSSDLTLQSDFEDMSKTFSFAEKKKTPKLGFVFTGQGAQWIRMGSQLMSYYPSFLRSIRILDKALGLLPDAPEWTIEDELLADSQSSRVNEAEYSQPLCTAIQIAIVDLLTAWGIKPVVTVGHSSGEIGAAYAAGHISATEAIVVAFYRGKVVRDINTNGAMMAVGLGKEGVEPYLEDCDGKVTVACHNSPVSVTLSGDAEALAYVKSKLDKENIFARQLMTGGKAYHSSHMKPASARYEAMIQRAKEVLPFEETAPSDTILVSSVTGAPVLDDAQIDEYYWSANLISPVLFNQAVQRIATEKTMFSVDTLVEIGPHSALAGPIKQIKAEHGLDKLNYIPTLIRGQDSSFQILKLAGELFLRDYPLDMDRVTLIEKPLPGGKVQYERGSIIVDLPTYQWNYGPQNLFAEPRQSAEHRKVEHARHDVLGRKIPGGSQVEPVWRNVLRIKDLPWLKDHSLGGEAVFPAAAYFSMAIEGITQINESRDHPVSIYGYTLRDISIKTALVTPDDDDGIEVLCNMRPSIHSESGIDSTWWDFNVSSHSQQGGWKDHMTGTIAVNTRPRGQKPKEVPRMAQRATGKSWNQALREVGFDYGPSFQDMEDIRFDGKNFTAFSKTLVKKDSGLMNGESRYALHPSTVDSCLQLVIVSIYAGKMKDVTCGAVPVQVDEVAIWPPTAKQLEDPAAHAYSWTDDRGIRSFRSGTQLVASDGELLLDITDLRSVSYEAAVPPQSHEPLKAQPYMEMVWKPDIDSVAPGTQTTISKLAEMVSHKTPGAKVLDLDGHNSNEVYSQMPQLNYTAAVLSDDNVESIAASLEGIKNAKVEKLEVIKENAKVAEYDLILANGIEVFDADIDFIYESLSSGGRAVFNESADLGDRFSCTKLSNPDQAYPNLVLAVPAEYAQSQTADAAENCIVLVYREQPGTFVSGLQEACSRHGWSTRLSALQGISVQDGEKVIMLADLEAPLLLSLTEQELTSLQTITSKAASLVWVSPGALLPARMPEHAMASGLARSVTSENASLDFMTLDVDLETTSVSTAIGAVTNAVRRQIEKTPSRETEYCVSDGQAYISRLVPNTGINSIYSVDKTESTALPFDSSMPVVGRVKSGKVVFERDSRPDELLEPHHVEVNIALSGLNKYGVQVIQGQDYANAFSHEITGTITKVGSAVRQLQAGDQVIGFNFDRYASVQRVHEEMVAKLNHGGDPAQALTIPMAYSAAIHGLQDLARVGNNENVLVLDSAGSAGAAAVKIGQIQGATVFVATHSESEKARIASACGLPEERVLAGFDGTPSQVKTVFGDHGIDVLFCSGSSPEHLVRECWRQIAPFGRVVECGRKNPLKRSALDTVPFHRGANYFSFDIRDLYHKKPQVLGRVLRMSLQLYRAGAISPVETAVVRHLTELDSSVESFTDGFLQPKTILSYEATTSPLNMASARPTVRLQPDATYFLVGCLGGLGRSLTSWMMEKGARRFAFLSRSGTDSPQAATLVKDIEAKGADVQVIRGDVGSKDDVERAVQSVPTSNPIKGVVHAAANFQDAIFHTMTHSQWTNSIKAKVVGAVNLHNALARTPVDFFVMTSSTSGTLGTPGQANYAAANAFLDSFARYRVSKGQAACSLVLPMVLGVGYVAENPMIEEALARKGIYGIDEEHMLQSFEVAVATETNMDANGTDHVVVGLDPAELQKSVNRTDTTDAFWLNDVRFGQLLHTIKQAAGSGSNDGSGAGGQSVLTAIKTASSVTEAIEITSKVFTEKLVRLLLLDPDEIEPESKAIADYGLDSMIGVELRNWIFKELGLDISFQKLLDSSLTITKFAAMVCEKQGVTA